LSEVGITTVRDLATADVDRLVDDLERLGDFHPDWKRKTLSRNVEEWVNAAVTRVGRTPDHEARPVVVVLTIWVDEEGRPARTRARLGSPEQLESATASWETVGWSPLGFSTFVTKVVGLAAANELTEETVEQKTLVEWSHHLVEGDIVRGGKTIERLIRVPTEGLGEKGEQIRWRLVATLVPFGGGTALECQVGDGTASIGDSIESRLAVAFIPQGFYRCWLDLAVSPPARIDQTLAVEGREPVPAE
jgi:hypothetical protein